MWGKGPTQRHNQLHRLRETEPTQSDLQIGESTLKPTAPIGSTMLGYVSLLGKRPVLGIQWCFHFISWLWKLVQAYVPIQ